MGGAGEKKLLVLRLDVAKPVLRAVEMGLVGVAVPARAAIGGDVDLGELGLAFLDRRLLVVGIDENIEIDREVLAFERQHVVDVRIHLEVGIGDRLLPQLFPFRFLRQVYASAHQQKGQPKPLAPAREKLWQEAIAHAELKQYPHVTNVLALKGQHFPAYFDILIDPYDKEAAVEKSEAEFSKINIPTYTGSGWYGYTYKTHLNGAQNWFRNIKAPHKKLLLAGPAHLDRPIKAFHNEMLRWYDQWLKGIDTGILNDPPVRFWVMGANEWRSASDWPPPETQWIKFYLRGWERLTTEPFTPSSADDYQAPDAFAQMPASQTNRIQKLRYLSEPLPDDVTIAGPSVLHLYAAIDQDDTNWIVILKDVGPDVGVQTAREGERDITPGLHERELTRGWLKASHRAVDPTRSLPGRPWHPLTLAARKPVAPGEINEYTIEIMATANQFKQGHRICVEITSLDVATGVGSATNVEYIPYHICSSKTVLHRIYHDPRHPSHLLLPVIANA